MRIAGTNIPDQKRIVVSLTYIFGVGLTLSKKILQSAGISEDARTKNLSVEEADKLRAIVEKGYKVEGDLRRDIIGNIKRLKDIKSYRGIRHMKHLPVHGQRTKTNSRTVRGNARKTMGSGKRPPTKKM